MTRKTMKPRVDRGQLQQVIAGLSEGILLIDPDGTIVWANEAALVMHGCSRLEQLGTNAAGYRKRFILRYRNNHLLTANQYPLARVAKGERFSDVTVEVRSRTGQDLCRVHQVGSLLLTDGDGAVELLALVGSDVTEWRSAEERFERTFAANPAPAVICRLSDMRYIKANQGFLEMTGCAREDIIERPFHEFDVLRGAEHRDEALGALNEHRTISQQEATLRLKNGHEQFVIVAGHPIEIEDENCMLFTFINLDRRKKTELALRHSEERFAKAFRLAPVPMLVCSQHDLRVIEANDAFAAITSQTHADLAGRSIADLGFWVQERSLSELRVALEANLDIRDYEIHLRARDGADIECLLSAEPVTIQDEACLLCVVQDITDRKRSEADLVAAIEAVMKDTSWFSRTVMEKLAQIRRPGGLGGELATLTPRERQVLELICKGQTDTEIAAALKLSRNTVRNHVATLYGKIGVNRRSAAVVWGRERGLAAY
jgi:PAS domain S-box-containing protein